MSTNLGMREGFGKLAGAVVMAASFFLCVIIAAFGGAGWGGFGQMVLGFGIGAVLCLIFAIMRVAVMWFVGTLLLLGTATVAILLGWKWMALGAGVAALNTLILYFMWMRPYSAQPFQHVDYAKEQERLYQEEKARAAGGPGAPSGSA